MILAMRLIATAMMILLACRHHTFSFPPITTTTTNIFLFWWALNKRQWIRGCSAYPSIKNIVDYRIKEPRQLVLLSLIIPHHPKRFILILHICFPLLDLPEISEKVPPSFSTLNSASLNTSLLAQR
ncbi:hypothetical protein AAHE18_13G246300 [Arachis hypogaea]